MKRVRTGVRYKYKDSEIVIIGYDFDESTLKTIRGLKETAWLLKPNEFKDYLFYSNAFAYEPEKDNFFFMSVMNYAPLEEIEEIKDFDVYLLKLKMTHKEFFNSVPITLRTQEYMEQEVDNVGTDTYYQLEEVYKQSDIMTKLASEYYKEFKQKNVLRIQSSKMRLDGDKYVLTSNYFNDFAVDISKHNFYILFVLACTSAVFVDYYRKLCDDRRKEKDIAIKNG